MKAQNPDRGWGSKGVWRRRRWVKGGEEVVRADELARGLPRRFRFGHHPSRLPRAARRRFLAGRTGQASLPRGLHRPAKFERRLQFHLDDRNAQIRGRFHELSMGKLTSAGDDGAEALSGGKGITDEDMVRILAFLEKSRFERSADDLRPSVGKSPE